MHQDPRKTLLEHSQAKVRLLRTYLVNYLSVLTNATSVKRIRIFDLFCGRGIYDNDGEGSPYGRDAARTSLEIRLEKAAGDVVALAAHLSFDGELRDSLLLRGDGAHGEPHRMVYPSAENFRTKALICQE